MNFALRPRLRPVNDAIQTFAGDVMAGLLAEPKRLPPKYFYDQRGSHLFEEITQLPEYIMRFRTVRKCAPSTASAARPTAWCQSHCSTQSG
jgi:uncharacterized SAM-dependent methyltransferase